MEELCKKYPALRLPILYIVSCKLLVSFEINKESLYTDFKQNISCIGLSPEEYETVIKWVCDTMEYTI